MNQHDQTFHQAMSSDLLNECYLIGYCGQFAGFKSVFPKVGGRCKDFGAVKQKEGVYYCFLILRPLHTLYLCFT